MTREETVRNLLTELIDMIDNGSQRDLDRADEIGTSILKLFEQEQCDDVVSRQAVIEAISEGCQEWRGIYGRCEELINALPSVTPSRHVNCEIAEHDGNGCLGYSHYGDDFPIEECLHCPKYTSYEEE